MNKYLTLLAISLIITGCSANWSGKKVVCAMRDGLLKGTVVADDGDKLYVENSSVEGLVEKHRCLITK